MAALPEIERAIRFVARRQRLNAAEAEEFAGEARLALIQNDYQILHRFQGRSSMRTYLVTVIHRLFLDHRRRMWGKWRPSAEAERRGTLAVRMEVLLYRDGLSVDEAVETLRVNQGVTETREALADLARDLPVRVSRKPTSEEDLAEVPAADGESPEAQLDSQSTAARTQALLRQALEGVPARDRILVRLRFEDGLSVADISRLLHTDQKRLYRDLERVLASLRRALEDGGLHWAEVGPLIEGGQCHLCLCPESAARRPSPCQEPT
jgi:RNA polymerase sigma factor (sigma-70 family)